MKTLINVILLLTSYSAFAGGNHFHPVKVITCPSNECTPEQIKGVVPKAIVALAKYEKIDPSWGSKEIEEVKEEPFAKGIEWKVTLVDRDSDKDVTKQKRRYVFITLSGLVVGSNDSGK